MKQFDSDLFGVIPEPETFPELMELLLSPEDDSRGQVRLWRGQADLKWRLDSSGTRRLHRSGALKIPVPDASVKDAEWQLSYYEKYLLDRAEQQGFRHHAGRTLTDLELLARLRHYGAATRLLDMSKSALVALWFAAADQHQTRGGLFGIHSYFIGRSENDPQREPYDDLVKGLLDIDHPITFSATGLTPRMAAQHSQFLYSGVSSHQRGSIRIASGAGTLLAIAVSPKMKALSVKILKETFDIHRFSLFPDLEGFAAGHSERFGEFEMERW